MVRGRDRTRIKNPETALEHRGIDRTDGHRDAAMPRHDGPGPARDRVDDRYRSDWQVEPAASTDSITRRLSKRE
jgi:hypothetical protein